MGSYSGDFTKGFYEQEPCCRRDDRAMPLKISVPIKFFNAIVWFLFLCHSTAFLYRPTSATTQMLKSHKVRWFSQRHSNLGSILRVFVLLTQPYTLILGVFPLHQIAQIGVNVSRDLKLFSREIIFEVFQPMGSQYLNVRDGQTDRRTLLWQ